MKRLKKFAVGTFLECSLKALVFGGISIGSVHAEELGGYDTALSQEVFLKTYQGFECADYKYGPDDKPEANILITQCQKPDIHFPNTYPHPSLAKGFNEQHNLVAVRFYEGKIMRLVIRIPEGISTKMAGDQLSKKTTAKPTYHLAKTPPIEGSYYAGAGGVCSAQYALNSGLVYVTALPNQGKVNLKYVFDAGEFEFMEELATRCEQKMNSDSTAASILYYMDPARIEKSLKDIQENIERIKQNNQKGFKF